MRLRHWWMFQRAAWRSLFRRRVSSINLPTALETYGPPHPSMLCRCYGPVVSSAVELAHMNHDPGCPWLAAMCRACGGTGWCEHCGGDGTAPENRPSANLPPSWVWCGGCQRPGECPIVTCTNHQGARRG